MRIHEFVKTLGMDKSKEAIAVLEKHNIKKTASSTITDEEKEILLKAFKKSQSSEPAKPSKDAVKADDKKNTVKPETRKESKPQVKVESKPEVKAKTETRPETKTESKPEVKAEPKKEPVKDASKDANAKPQPKVETPVTAQTPAPEVRQPVKRVNIFDNMANKQAADKNKDKRPGSGNITQVYNPQNSGSNMRRDRKPFDRDNRDNRDNRQGGVNRDNRDNRGQGFNRDNRDNRDNRGQGFNRDNRDNRDNRGQGFNRDNRDNRDNRGQGFNRDNRDNRDNRGQGFNRNNRDNGGFNKDADNVRDQRGNQRPQRRDDSRNAASSDIRLDTKENRRNLNNTKEREKQNKDYQDKENIKFMNNKKNVVKETKKEEDTIKTIILPDELTIKDLADKMKVAPAVIVKKLFMKGTIVSVNHDVTFEQAEEIALEFNCICEHEEKVDVIAELLKDIEDDPKDLVPRPPVVCVMGHVDHGKTSLLDAIRSTNVTSKESGGITQHIGAYVTQINDRKITFLDTPGHEAFTAMRMRGAQSTDIAVLVVAADDGVMPQTVEAINHAKAAGVEIIVAVNKIDKPSANIERVKQELMENGLVPVDWGGSTEFVPVSARTKEGIDDLLETITLTADILELKANPNRKCRGLVIEAQLDKGKGPVATILVQKGTLKVGDNVAAGTCYGKIRAMMDDKGRRVREALPSTPVEVLGLNDVPNAGEIIVSTESDKEARNYAETFIREGKIRMLNETKSKLSLDDLFSQIKAGNVKELNIVVKADVQGSVEAVKASLVKLSNEEVVVKVIHGGVGNINESDVILASASNAIIIGFNVRPDNQAREIADKENVDLRLYKVIYNAIEDVEAAMKGMLDPKYEEKITGHAEIRMIYKASGIGNIAGSYVLDGVIKRNSKVRVMRAGELVFEGELASLKRFKDDAKEVKEGYECGIVIDGFNDIMELDVVEAYEMVEVPR